MSEDDTALRPDGQLAWMLARVNQRFEDDLAKRLKPEGLAVEQFRILDALTRGGPAPMNTLAKVALVEPPTMTKIIDRMVASGLVFRAPDDKDRRKIMIVMTDEGAALYDKLSTVSADQERQIELLLDGSKAQTLRNLLVSLI
ncbi:MAG: MarR family transcriptional regulator [Pseudomonadota bacterium]